MHILQEIIKNREINKHAGIYSACSASPIVIEAVLERARITGSAACIEATANQINQFGGYTGMLPADFARLVHDIAVKVGFPREKLILGGDHLGPLVWKSCPIDEAMQKAEVLISCYVKAGFDKIHIDTSMPLYGESTVSNDQILTRALRLAKAAENAAAESSPPVYVIGSEVPVPGGATKDDGGLSVTTAESFNSMVDCFKRGFHEAGLHSAWERVVAAVVQPGVEFGDDMIHKYDKESAKSLTQCLKNFDGIVFEGHSTDYQTAHALREMVEDGIAILKVGPALTFAQRECTFALAEIERELLGNKGSDYINVLERTMLKNPVYWEKYYAGNEAELAFKRKYSFADRCRYYLSDKEVANAFDLLCHNLSSIIIPLSLLSQYLPEQYRKVREGSLQPLPEELIKDYIKQSCISLYEHATT